MQDRESYIAELVRREDRDRFLTAMFIPADRRADVLAIYAFNVELSRIRQNVSETLIARMKYQWWRDVIAAIFEGKNAPQGNPVTQALEWVITRRGIQRDRLDEMITTRERELDTDDSGFSFANILELETYAAGTSAALINVVLHILEAVTDESQRAARHVGIATALVGVLRAVLAHASENRLLLPKDSASTAGLTGAQDIAAHQNSASVSKVIKELAATAQAHLDAARKCRVPKAAVPALLLAYIAEGYLRTLRRAQFDVADSRVVTMRAGVLGLTWAAWRGRY